MRALVAQTRAEVAMTIRRGETLLLTIGIPVLLLIFFSLTRVVSTPGAHRIDFIAPGILALCVLSTSLVALSIATGFERSSGVLRRLHVTPLGRRRLVGAKIAGVLVTEIIQVVAISLVALLLTWRPDGGWLGAVEVVAALLLGSIGFAGIGLALAGSLRAEVNLAASNGLYLVLLLLSGHRRSLDVPADRRPSDRHRPALGRVSAGPASDPRTRSFPDARGLDRPRGLGSRRTAAGRANVPL